MAEESDLERTEPASSRRIEQAREEGNVPQSKELAAFVITATGIACLWLMGGWLSERSEAIMRHGLTIERQAVFDAALMGLTFAALAWEGLALLTPILIATMVGALLTPFLLGSWVISPKAMALNLERLDPLAGLKRMFSWHSFAEMFKGLLKAALLGGVVWWVVLHEQERLFALVTQPIESALPSFAEMLLFASLMMVFGLALIAAIDVPYQLWQYYVRLRMTKEELRKEFKEMEGDPYLKARIRGQQRELARKRMMAEVPKADVVVTNPTHFAVALKYDPDAMGAPTVVAKGMNLIAQNIRSLAEEHRVPVLEAPPLARALYHHTEIGEQIPAQLYTAVAEVMAYVYRLNEYLAGGALPPAAPENIVVPDGFDPGEVA